MCETRNQQDFIARMKQKQNKVVTKKKTYQKLVLNKLKVMGNFIFIYTY